MWPVSRAVKQTVVGADQLFHTNRQLIRHLRGRLKEGGFSVPELAILLAGSANTGGTVT